ncbi:hypoxanthine phosphoribosyltransferase [soil metagenome]
MLDKNSSLVPEQDIPIVRVKDKRFRVFIPYEDIQERIRIMAAAMTREYEGKQPMFLAVLTGSFMFAADLMKHINIDCEIAFTRLSSYSGTASTGKVDMVMDFKENIEGRHIVILEDIVDSGTTLSRFLPMLQERNPASIAIATLLIKPEALKHPLDVPYVGFRISNEFILGYGLDYDGSGRNFKDIYQVVEE